MEQEEACLLNVPLSSCTVLLYMCVLQSVLGPYSSNALGAPAPLVRKLLAPIIITIISITIISIVIITIIIMIVSSIIIVIIIIIIII